MTVADFFNTWPGMFLAQSFLHSLVAALLVDIALLSWNIEDPRVRLPFRVIVVVTPIFSFPFYQLAFPDRASGAFRLGALFDITRWLGIEIWGSLTAGLLFLLFLGFAAAVFILQELIPIIRHAASAEEDALSGETPAESSVVTSALAGIQAQDRKVLILDDAEPFIFSTTGRQPVICLSRGLVDRLDAEELKAAIAHEIGHIIRSRRPLMVLVFLLRILMFYNPVVLMEFRRIVQEEEKICDDFAAALTGNRAALAGALSKLSTVDESDLHGESGHDRLHVRLEEYSHSLLIDSRISRLEEPPPVRRFGSRAAFAVTVLTVACVNYFLV